MMHPHQTYMSQAEKQRVLAAAEFQLQDAQRDGSGAIRGRWGGSVVTFSISSRPGWSVRVTTTVHLPLAIDLYQPTIGTRFLMDAVPLKMAQEVLTKELSRRIIALNPARITVKPGEVLLTHYGNSNQRNNPILESIEVAVALAKAAAQAAKHRHLSGRGHPFRGSVEPNSAILRHGEEVEAALTRQEKRGGIDQAIHRAASVAVSIAQALFLALYVALVLAFCVAQALV